MNYVWEQRKLGKVADIGTGKLDANAMNETGEYDFYTSGIQKYKIDVPAFEGPAITIAGNGATVGYMHLANGKFNAYQRTYVLSAFQANREFLFYEIGNKLPKKISQEARTGNIPYIVMDMLTDLQLSIPCEQEQRKLGEFMMSLDHLITLHQHKCDETKKLKKCMLQKMFPKNGKKVPEIRFDGFANDWEQRKLNEVAEFNPKSDLPESFEYVDLESVVGTEMVSHRTESKETAPSRAQRLAQTGDVFFQTVRPYQRNNYLFTKPDNNYVFSTGYAHMRPKIDAEFLMCFLQTDSFVKVVLDNCTGTSYPAINSNDLSNLEIDLPTSEDEQRRIGCFITNLDHLITLHQHKCDELQNLKKYMLQNMFV